MKSKVLAGLFLGLLLIGSIATKPVLASPHHIICEKHNYKAKPGDVVRIPYKMHFDKEEQATNELYGDKVKDWDCSLHSEKNKGKKGEKVSCYIEVHVPPDAKNGTYGLILQDKDANGKVTSRVSIYIQVGEGGGPEVHQEMHYYDGWIAYENFPREVELPAHNVDVTVGYRVLEGHGTYRITATFTGKADSMLLFSTDFTKDGEFVYPLGLSGWYVGGTYTITIRVGNITGYEPKNPSDVGVLLEEKTITINVYCPGSENAVLLDTLILNAQESSDESTEEPKAAVVVPEPEPQRSSVCFPRPWLGTFQKLLPV